MIIDPLGLAAASVLGLAFAWALIYVIWSTRGDVDEDWPRDQGPDGPVPRPQPPRPRRRPTRRAPVRRPSGGLMPRRPERQTPSE